MKIFVLVKQVPDTETKIKLGPAQVDFSGVKWVMNPYDEYAVEEALKFKEAHAGTQVIAITVGPKARVTEVLRTTLAMGADEGILVNSDETLSSIGIARALAAVVNKEGPAQIIFGGKLSIDANNSSVCQQVAEFLSLPHATVVSKIEYAAASLVIEREIEGGTKEIWELKLPAVLGVNKGLNSPRYASLPGIMKAKKRVLKEYEWSDLVNTTQGQTRFVDFELPKEKPAGKIMTGDMGAQVQSLVQSLRHDAKVI